VAVVTAYARRLATSWSPPGGERTERILLALGAWRLAV